LIDYFVSNYSVVCLEIGAGSGVSGQNLQVLTERFRLTSGC